MFLSFPDGPGVVALFLWSRGYSWKLTGGLADVCYNNLALERNLPQVTWKEGFIVNVLQRKDPANYSSLELLYKLFYLLFPHHWAEPQDTKRRSPRQ